MASQSTQEISFWMEKMATPASKETLSLPIVSPKSIYSYINTLEKVYKNFIVQEIQF
jgi:hypothetical protein